MRCYHERAKTTRNTVKGKHPKVSSGCIDSGEISSPVIANLT